MSVLILSLFALSSVVLAQTEEPVVAITIDNAAQLTMLKALEGHEGAVWSVVFSPDGTLLASGGEDKSVRLWVATTGEQKALLEHHAGPVYAVSFSPDGKQLISTGQDMHILHWDTETEKLSNDEGLDANIIDMMHSLISETVALRSIFWLEDTPMAVGDVSLVFPPVGGTISFNGGDPAFLSASVIADEANPIIAIGTSEGIRIGGSGTLTLMSGYSATVTSVVFSPDGTLLASGGDDKSVRLWNVEGTNLTNAAVLDGHTDDVTGVAWSSDGALLASVGLDGQLILWDVQAQAAVATIAVQDNTPLHSVAFNPDGTLLAVAGDNGTIWLYGLRGA